LIFQLAISVKYRILIASSPRTVQVPHFATVRMQQHRQQEMFLKVKSVLYVYAPMLLKFFWSFVMEKMEIQVFALYAGDDSEKFKKI
jgi:hypothetical protein